jgi:hypothetical protein
MTCGGYPEYRINKGTAYRVPPGWASLVAGLLHELDDMRGKGILGQDFQVTQMFDSNGSLAAVMAGRFRQDDVAGLLRSYAARSRETCAECGYEGTKAGLRRPTCRACMGARNRSVR